jgi:hypothetical protein
VARGLELDWIVIRVQPLRTLLAVVTVGCIAAALVFFAYKSLNLPPQARASFIDGRWEEAETLADGARRRFEALAGAGGELVGAGKFFSLEGRVEVQRAGQTEWEGGSEQQSVFNGDFVRTGRDGEAEILFADGSLYRIAPNSLLEIHNEMSPESSGTVKMVVGRINVYTSGTPSTVTTDTARTEIDRDSRVAVDVAAEDQETRVATFQGSARIRSTRGDEIVINEREAVAAKAGGTITEKQQIPAAPLLISPQNNVGFDVGGQKVIELAWRGRPGSGTVHLQVGRSKNFDSTQLEVDAPDLARDKVRIKLVSPGTYFWRVACRSRDSLSSEWSAARRFRVYSSVDNEVAEDTTPPELTIDPPQQLGRMFIIEGSTEVGATITINGERVELGVAGTFRKTVEMFKEGWNDIVIVATDPSGNRSEHRERVFVEVY